MNDLKSLMMGCLIAISVVGCTHPMSINSEPPGAKVWVDGNFQGVTPLTYQAKRKAFGGGMVIKVEKEGYKSVQRSYVSEADTGEAVLTVVGGLVCCVPIFAAPWVWKYPASVNFDLEEGSGETSQRFRMIHPQLWVLVPEK